MTNQIVIVKGNGSASRLVGDYDCFKATTEDGFLKVVGYKEGYTVDLGYLSKSIYNLGSGYTRSLLRTNKVRF